MDVKGLRGAQFWVLLSLLQLALAGCGTKETQFTTGAASLAGYAPIQTYVGDPVSSTTQVKGYNVTFRLAKNSNPLPEGMFLDARTGTISGTPTVATPATNVIVEAVNPGGVTSIPVSILVRTNQPEVFYSSARGPVDQPMKINFDTLYGKAAKFTVSKKLPDGLTLNALTGEISGIPTVPGVWQSQIAAWPLRDGDVFYADIQITIDAAPILSFSYSPNDIKVTVGQAISPAIANTTGGTVTSFALDATTPTLPAGLSLNSSTGTISGTPSVVAAKQTFKVVAKNSTNSITASISFTVVDIPPSGCSFKVAPLVGVKGSAIVDALTCAGGPVTSAVVAAASPALPTGLSINPAGVSGTPSVISAATVYTFDVSNSGGSTTVSLNITINDQAITGLSYSPNPAIYTKNVAITPNKPSSSGGAVVNYSISPDVTADIGLNFDTATGILSGTPNKEQVAKDYTITAKNTNPTSASVVLRIIVNPEAPCSLTYAPNPSITDINQAVLIKPTSGCGPVASYSISPPFSVAGLTFNSSTGVISGTGTAITPSQTYTITATNISGSTNASVTVQILDRVLSGCVYLNPAPTYTKGIAIAPPNTLSCATGVPTSVVVSSMPAGVSANSVNGTITGTPSVFGVFSPVITADNGRGPVTVPITITIVDAQITGLAYSPNPVIYTDGVTITPSIVAYSGGAVTSFSISPDINADIGLNFDTVSGVLSGTPNKPQATKDYTITARNTNPTSASVVLRVTVNPKAPCNLVYTPNPGVGTIKQAFSMSPSSGCGPVASYSISPPLAIAGLSFNTSTGVISGTPTPITSSTPYTVTATNITGSTTASISIQINDEVLSGCKYANPAPTYTKGVAIAANTITCTTGTISSATISGLPGGLSGNLTNGSITGSASVLGTYTPSVIVSNAVGSMAVPLTITVVDQLVTGCNYIPNPATYIKGTAITASIPTTTGGAPTGFSMSGTLNTDTGLNFDGLTGMISGTPTKVSTLKTYTVTPINSAGPGTSCTVNISVVDQKPTGLAYTPNPLNGQVGIATSSSPSWTGGAVTAWTRTGTMPPGIGFNTVTGVFSGTPTTAGSWSSQVTASNSGGSSNTVTVSFTITIAPPSFTYSPNPAVLTRDITMAPMAPTVTGRVDVWSISPALPLGLVFNTSTGVISGLPTDSSYEATYTIIGTDNTTSLSGSFDLKLSVTALSFALDPAVYTTGVAIVPNGLNVSGFSGFSITPALPAGLTFNTLTGQITGIPSVSSIAKMYTINAVKGAEAVVIRITLSVLDEEVIASKNRACALTHPAGRYGVLKCWGEVIEFVNSSGTITSSETQSKPFEDGRLPTIRTGNQMLAVGYRHACVVNAGKVYCWGENGNGELGDGTTVDRQLEGQVAAMGTNQVQQIVAGNGFTCALKNDGSIWCWGNWNYGGAAVNPLVPTNVNVAYPVLATNKSISAGEGHVCAITASDDMFCFGKNDLHQVGTFIGPVGSEYQKLHFNKRFGGALLIDPVDYRIEKVLDVKVGANHSCALTLVSDYDLFPTIVPAFRRVFCWGANNWSQIGIGTMTTFEDNKKVQLGTTQTGSANYTDGSYLAVGGNTSAVVHHAMATGTSTLVMWGELSPAWGTVYLPSTIAIGSGYKRTSCGGYNTFYLVDNAQTGYAWGNSDYGQFGSGRTSGSVKWPPDAISNFP